MRVADDGAGGGPAPGPRRARSALGAAGGVAGLTLIARALGFLRWIAQASAVGAGTVAGAYASANQLPNVLYEVVVGGALAATIVPLLAPAVAASRRQEAERTAGALLGIVLVLLVPLGAALALAAEPIAGLLPVSQGEDSAVQIALAADFLRMFALQVPLYGVGVVLTGVLQAHNRFGWTAITPILSSVVVMAAYGLYGAMTQGAEGASDAALRVLGWGTTAGVAALSLPLLWPIHRMGLRLRPSIRLDAAAWGRALRLGSAGVVTLVAQQISVLAVLALARWGGTTGTVAVHQYTQAVYVLPYAVLAVPVATVLYPRLSAAFDERARAGGPGPGQDRAGVGSGARELSARATAAVSAVAVAGAGMLLAASHGAERFFLLLADVQGMSMALATLAPGIVGYCLIYQITRVLFAADRARDAALVTAAGWLLVAVVSWLAVGGLSRGGDAPATLLGLAVGQSAGMILAGAGLMAVMARFLGWTVLRPSLRVLGAAAPVALVGGLAVRAASAALASPWAGIAVAATGALLTAAAALGAAHLADRGLLSGLRAPSAPLSETE
ncbi:murein biosynthesis integral membrane protein MurJ [Actinomyces slackii]|uniref:Probable peptidoglycan biosynthesis protein MurJ n=1 Tax=Actinomyces slackii TaxID=52774 RepID=A0A448KEW0_9ACTO|nr:lipid II flippase MurJ [Actinomyces slackii]VEG75449.1 Probable peptidoglycan biosynthesis protein MurJ [Actinomyces slackii]